REVDAMDEGDAVRLQLAMFTAKSPVYPQLFDGAGPADDGTLDGARVSDNVARFEDPIEAEDLLGQWLHEYISYALFLARPHLRRAQDARAAAQVAPKARLSELVSTIVEPIAPHAVPQGQGREE